MKLFAMLMLLSGNAMAFGTFNFGVSDFHVKKKPDYIPSWVQDIKNGGGSKVNTGTGTTLFRDISYGKGDKQELCNISKKQNINNVLSMLPGLRAIPTTIEHVFYNESDGYCATTISIKARTLNKLEELSLKLLLKQGE